MRTVPFLVSLGLVSAAVLPREPNSGLVRREPEPEPEPGILIDVDLKGESNKVRRGIDINIDLDGKDKSRRYAEPKAEPEPEPALYRREPEPEPRGGGGGATRGTSHKDNFRSGSSDTGSSRTSSSSKDSQSSKGSKNSKNSKSSASSSGSSVSSQGYGNPIKEDFTNYDENDFVEGDITRPVPPRGNARDKKKEEGEKTLYRRQNLLTGFDENAAANTFLSDRGLATWNDFSGPIDGSDACVVFKALEGLAFSLIEPTEDILAEAGTKVFVPANQQSGPLVVCTAAPTLIERVLTL